MAAGKHLYKMAVIQISNCEKLICDSFHNYTIF